MAGRRSAAVRRPPADGFRFFRSVGTLGDVNDAPDLQHPAAVFVAAARTRVASGERLRLAVGDQSAELDPEVAEPVLDLVDALLAGSAFEVTPVPEVLTTGQAAELLGVTRPTVVALIDKGDLPATRVGTRRRLAAADVYAYRDRARDHRRVARAERARRSDVLDLDDIDA
jgi:excisionase family DNA binding protein